MGEVYSDNWLGLEVGQKVVALEVTTNEYIYFRFKYEKIQGIDNKGDLVLL